MLCYTFLQIFWFAIFCVHVIVVIKCCFLTSFVLYYMGQLVQCKPLVFHIEYHCYALSVLNGASPSFIMYSVYVHLYIYTYICISFQSFLWSTFHVMQSCWMHQCSAHNVEKISFVIIQLVSLTRLLDFIIDYRYIIPCVYRVTRLTIRGHLLYELCCGCPCVLLFIYHGVISNTHVTFLLITS